MDEKEKARNKLERMKKRRITASKVLLAVSIIYFVTLLLIILTIYYIGIGYAWTQRLQISLPTLAVTGCIMYSLFIIIILLLYITYYVERKRVEELEKPKPLYYKGKRLLVYTYPEGVRGGIFSRTILPVDDNTVVNLRFQMVKPEELWGKKEED
ncbi:MAG TPA: hypothetical protein ENI45_03470 [Thermoplasmatales archaeon]|nr:hypothetical protein [Thermoplasmatales archaeon]